MDPLSITASIVTLLTAANHVAIGLNKLSSIDGAPAAVRALNNEVEDLRLVLTEAEPLLRKHGDVTMPSAVAAISLEPIIERAKNKLKDLEAIVGNRLLARMRMKDKLGWMFEQDKVQSALGDVRTARTNVTTMLSVVSRYVRSRESDAETVSYLSKALPPFV